MLQSAIVAESCWSSVTDVLHPLQVVLPMLDSADVEPGWTSEADFLTGIALVQAMPGPLFKISAYVGEAC